MSLLAALFPSGAGDPEDVQKALALAMMRAVMRFADGEGLSFEKSVRRAHNALKALRHVFPR